MGRRGGGRQHEGRRGGGGGGRRAAPGGRRRRSRGANPGRERRAATEAAGGRRQAAGGGQRPRAGPHAQRQHGLRRPAHAHPHRAGRPQAVQGGDAAPGLQLHLAPGQRAAPAEPRRPAALPAAPHLYLLPQRAAQAAPRGRGAAGGVSCRLRSSRRREADFCTAFQQLLLRLSCFGSRCSGFVRGHRASVKPKPADTLAPGTAAIFARETLNLSIPAPLPSPTCVTWWNSTRPTHRRQGLTRGRPLLLCLTPSAALRKVALGCGKPPLPALRVPARQHVMLFPS